MITSISPCSKSVRFIPFGQPFTLGRMVQPKLIGRWVARPKLEH